MILAGRSNSFVRSVLVISRCSRYPADGCSSVPARGVASWISGTRVTSNAFLTSPGTRHESGGGKKDGDMTKKQSLEGNDERTVKDKDHVETEDRRVGRNGLARGEPNPLSEPDSSETGTRSHAVEDWNADGARGKQNWLEYQARLQAKVGLVAPEEGTRGPRGSDGGGGEASSRRARRKMAKGGAPTQRIPHAKGLEATRHTSKTHVTASISSKHDGYQSREGTRGSHSNHRVDVKDDSAAPVDFQHSGERHVSGHDSGRARARPPVPPDGGDNDSEVPTGESRQRSHFEQPGSAWKNLHVRANLMSLMKGLAGDYGVIEGLKERSIVKVRPTRPNLQPCSPCRKHLPWWKASADMKPAWPWSLAESAVHPHQLPSRVLRSSHRLVPPPPPQRTMSKVLPVFSSLVLDNPDLAFPGENFCHRLCHPLCRPEHAAPFRVSAFPGVRPCSASTHTHA